MAFGDNENDIELLAQAETACAMRTGNLKLLCQAGRAVDCVEDELRMLLQAVGKQTNNSI